MSRCGCYIGEFFPNAARWLLIVQSIVFTSQCHAFPGEALLNRVFCTVENPRFCTSSIFPAKQWIKEKKCDQEVDRTTEQYHELLAVVDFFFSTGNSVKEGVLLQKKWLHGCNPCMYDGIFCDYYNHIESIILRKTLLVKWLLVAWKPVEGCATCTYTILAFQKHHWVSGALFQLLWVFFPVLVSWSGVWNCSTWPLQWTS